MEPTCSRLTVLRQVLQEWYALTGHSAQTLTYATVSKRYLEQTSSHLIGKLKSFVVARMSFGKHVKIPLKRTSVVETVGHDLQGGIKRFDPEALAALERVLDVYNQSKNTGGQ